MQTKVICAALTAQSWISWNWHLIIKMWPKKMKINLYELHAVLIESNIQMCIFVV